MKPYLSSHLNDFIIDSRMLHHSHRTSHPSNHGAGDLCAGETDHLVTSRDNLVTSRDNPVTSRDNPVTSLYCRQIQDAILQVN